MIKTWARFFRIPLLPTVWCHVAAASILAEVAFDWHLALVFTGIYLFGMGDNDRQDLSRDLIDNPMRPLASGALSLTQASAVVFFVFALTGMGIMLIQDVWQAQMASVCLLMAFGYNHVFKKSRLLGPLAMAICRGSIYACFLGIDVLQPWVLAGYIYCVTLWSTTEDKHPGRKKFTLLFLLLLPWLDFVLLMASGSLTPSAVFLLAVPVVCRILVLLLQTKPVLTQQQTELEQHNQ